MIQVGSVSLGLIGIHSGLPGTEKLILLLLIAITYALGFLLMNDMLTSEFIRKTQLEADQRAAQQIQQTLHPQKAEKLPGYQLEMLYRPLREVGGDYFDIIELPDGQTLIAVADVSGKGMPAALLAANIQALVRSISSKGSELVLMADQINRHLCAYTPENRFATAFFVVLSHESGELTYVNAGHNAPILSSGRSETYLEPTGMPLGLFREAKFESRTATVPPGTRLLMFTDGLPDGIGGESPERCICDTLRSDAEQTMSALEALIDPKCKFRAN